MKKFLFVLIFIPVFCYSEFLNPFKNEYLYNSLDYKKFHFYNQIFFMSGYDSIFGGYSAGYNLTSIEYKFSPSFISYIHLGKIYNFSSGNNFFKNENNLTGVSLIYNPNPKLNFGIEYGATPTILNQSFFSPNNSLHLWLNKKIGDNINIQIEYYQITEKSVK